MNEREIAIKNLQQMVLDKKITREARNVLYQIVFKYEDDNKLRFINPLSFIKVFDISEDESKRLYIDLIEYRVIYIEFLHCCGRRINNDTMLSSDEPPELVCNRCGEEILLNDRDISFDTYEYKLKTFYRLKFFLGIVVGIEEYRDTKGLYSTKQQLINQLKSKNFSYKRELINVVKEKNNYIWKGLLGTLLVGVSLVFLPFSLITRAWNVFYVKRLKK